MNNDQHEDGIMLLKDEESNNHTGKSLATLTEEGNIQSPQKHLQSTLNTSGLRTPDQMIVSANIFLNSKLQNFNNLMVATPPIGKGLQAYNHEKHKVNQNLRNMLVTEEKSCMTVSNEKEVVV